MSKKIVLVSGHFNVLHPGHLRLLRFASEAGDHLIVVVESDRLAGKAAHVPEELRIEGVATNSYVDEVILADEPVINIIERFRPDIVVKGKEHEKKLNPELQVLAQYGGKLIFSSGETVFSSLDLIRREFGAQSKNTISLPASYLKRNKIEIDRLNKIVQSFQSLKVVVVGDLIIDEYITCEPLGMSQEDPTVVVTPIDSTRFLGGAGIVAAHAAGLGAEVHFVSVTGSDETREFSSRKLEENGVNAQLLKDPSRPTTLKQRYRSRGKSMLRVSHLHQGAISATLQNAVYDYLETIIEGADLLVFSDFNYGCLPQSLVIRVADLARKYGIVLAADSQSSSQVGDISRFKGMDLITPTEREARISTRNREDGLVVLAEELRKSSEARSVLLKMGEEGLLLHAIGQHAEDILTDQLPALNAHAKDVAGAGDSLLIASAMAITSGANIWEASCLGSIAAAIQVGRVGNTPLTSHQMLLELVP